MGLNSKFQTNIENVLIIIMIVKFQNISHILNTSICFVCFKLESHYVAVFEINK